MPSFELQSQPQPPEDKTQVMRHRPPHPFHPFKLRRLGCGGKTSKSLGRRPSHMHTPRREVRRENPYVVAPPIDPPSLALTFTSAWKRRLAGAMAAASPDSLPGPHSLVPIETGTR